MTPDDPSIDNRHDLALPLPEEASADSAKEPPAGAPNPAADLIRQRVQAAYGGHPAAAQPTGAAQLSKHQRFIYDLTSSGKSMPEIQTAWHEYYGGLTDADKNQVWQEFYNAHAEASHYSAAVPPVEPAPTDSVTTVSTQPAYKPPLTKSVKQRSKRFGNLSQQVLGKVPATAPRKAAHPMQSLIFGLGVGSIVVLVFLFGFFNERIIAPFIQPSRNITGTPIISDASASSEPEIIIPKINVEIPVVYGVKTVDEDIVNKALESGVVHYANTAVPGQNGNVVIVGHSSNNIFNKGKYKFAFVLLSRLQNGDTFYLQKDGQRYTYQVYKKAIVKPSDISVLGPTDKPASATLITCDPPGTTINRLVVTAQQINPDPSSNTAVATPNALATRPAVIPGNAPSLWSRLLSLIRH